MNNYKIKYIKYIFILIVLLLPNISEAANRYWVGGTATWDGTAGTKWALTSGGLGGQAVPTASDDVFFDAQSASTTPTVTLGAAASVKSLNFTGYTAIFNHGGYTLTIYGNVNFTNVTYRPTSVSAVIQFSTGAGIATTSGALMPNIIVGNSITLTLADNMAFTASTTNYIVINPSAAINMAGHNISGNSASNRVLIYSSVRGTPKTITTGGGTFANADFEDVTFANGGADLHLESITGLSGDCGGNTISGGGTLTMTTGAPQNWTDTAGGNWSDVGNWSGRVPLPQDDVTFSVAMQSAKTITADMPRLGKSIDFSSMTYTTTKPIFTSNISPNVITIYGSLTLLDSSLMSFTVTSSMYFEGRGAYTITTGGKIFANNFYIQAYGGTYTLLDSLSVATFGVWYGTFDADIYNVTASVVNLTNIAATHGINMGTGTWTITGTGNVWYGDTTNFTFNPEQSTLVISNLTNTAKNLLLTANNTVTGVGLTYNIVNFVGDNIILNGSNTFGTLNIYNAGLPNGLLLRSATTQTITGNIASNSSKGRIAILAAYPSGIATITRASGMFCGEYLNIASSTVATTGSATWYAANSTNVGNNSGWLFSQCPAPNTGAKTTSQANERISSSVAAAGAPGWFSTGGTWSYRKKISVDPQKVGSTTTSYLNNFPMLVSVIDSDLMFTSSGGHVASSTGGDIIFTAGDGTTALNYEIEKYTSTTGELVAWVRIPFMSSTSTIPIYMYYGNASAPNVSASTAPNVWDSNYVGIWHLPNGTTLGTNDSTTNGNTASIVNGTAAGVGKIDGGASFDAVNDYLEASHSGSLDSLTNVTISGWVNPTANYPISDGFEAGAPNLATSGDGAFWTGGGSPTGSLIGNEPTTVKSGTYAARASWTGTGQAALAYHTITQSNDNYVQVAMNVGSMTASANNLAQLRLMSYNNGGSNFYIAIRYITSTTYRINLMFTSAAGTQTLTGTNTFNVGTWYTVQAYLKTNVATGGGAQYWINGTSEGSSFTNDMTQANNQPNRVYVGLNYSGGGFTAGTVYFDDYTYFGSTQWLVNKVANDTSDVSPFCMYGIALIYNSASMAPAPCVTVGGVLKSFTSATTIPYGSLSYLAMTYDGTTLRGYINGTAIETLAASGNIDSSTTKLRFGTQGGLAQLFYGVMDEMRISSSARSTDWILTEYRNQNSPSTFYSYGGLENQNGRVNSSGTSMPAVKVRGGVKFH